MNKKWFWWNRERNKNLDCNEQVLIILISNIQKLKTTYHPPPCVCWNPSLFHSQQQGNEKQKPTTGSLSTTHSHTHQHTQPHSQPHTATLSNTGSLSQPQALSHTQRLGAERNSTIFQHCWGWFCWRQGLRKGSNIFFGVTESTPRGLKICAVVFRKLVIRAVFGGTSHPAGEGG